MDKNSKKKPPYLWIMWVVREKRRYLADKSVDKPVDSVDRWTYVLLFWV